MAKLRILSTALLGTLAMALPFTLLALGLVAFLDENLPRLAMALAGIDWSALRLEASARAPELAGMLVGQLVLMAILLFGGRRALENRAQA